MLQRSCENLFLWIVSRKLQVLRWIEFRLPQWSRNPERRLGARGEWLAAQYLKNKGYRVLLKNYRTTGGEIDIICRGGEELVFVEVKTRRHELHGRPADAVNRRKRRRIHRAAREYLRILKRPEVTHRYDIVEVIAPRGGDVDIRHIERIEV